MLKKKKKSRGRKDREIQRLRKSFNKVEDLEKSDGDRVDRWRKADRNQVKG